MFMKEMKWQCLILILDELLKREWKATSNRTLLPFFWASILLYKLIRAEIRKLFWKKKDFVYIPILTSIFYICLMSKRKQHIRQCIYLLAFLHICCSFTSYALSVMNSLDDRSKPSPRTHTCMSFSCFLQQVILFVHHHSNGMTNFTSNIC